MTVEIYPVSGKTGLDKIHKKILSALATLIPSKERIRRKTSKGQVLNKGEG